MLFINKDLIYYQIYPKIIDKAVGKTWAKL